jgi:peptidoglycan/LPS O-acetylase OafA/YrhL
MTKSVTDHNRRDIQYLRALAVASVVLYHFWANRLVSGFLGVDVFFVISGFLITSLILREVSSTGSLRLTAFWVRRIRRIFPAAITVIIAAAIATNLTMLGSQILTSGRHVFASAFSFENVLLGLDATDYDHRTDATSPLQHYWSLSVEEQFYLVWPVLIIGALWIAKRSKFGVNRILGISLAVIATGSLVYAIVIAQGVPASYFDTLARAWELAIGAGVALWDQRERTPWRGNLVANRISWLVLAAMFAVPGLSTLAPGIGILPSAIATAIILATGPIASTKPLPFSRPFLAATEWLGDRSYSIYLWHWPIVILLPVFLGHELGVSSKLAALAVILVLAELTYRFIENPVRRAKAPWTFKPVFAGSIALVTSAAVVAVTFLIPQNIGKQETTDDLSAIMLSTPTALDVPGSVDKYPYALPYCDGAGSTVFDCPLNSTLEFDSGAYPISPPRTDTCQYEVETMIIDCVMGDTSASRSIALVGDSHARAMWASLDFIGKRAGYAVHEFLTPRCSYRLYHFDWCTQHNREIAPRLNSGEFDLVVLAQAARVSYVSLENPTNPINPFAELYGELKTNGIPVAVVKDNPKRGPLLSTCLTLNPKNPGGCTRPLEPQVDLATQTGLDLGFPTINLDNVYCPDNQCGAVRGGMLVWRDNGHISPFYHLTAAPIVWSQLMENGLLSPQK